jgi:hypothetical protein
VGVVVWVEERGGEEGEVEEGGKLGEEEGGGVCGSSFDVGYRMEGEGVSFEFWSSSFSFNSKSNDIAMGPELGTSSCACSTMLMRRFRRSVRWRLSPAPPPPPDDVGSSSSSDFFVTSCAWVRVSSGLPPLLLKSKKGQNRDDVGLIDFIVVELSIGRLTSDWEGKEGMDSRRRGVLVGLRTWDWDWEWGPSLVVV